MKPLVSILIPAYNAAQWIDEAIRSAVDQTWSNKEIIIVDDGSRDNTLEHARTYECGWIKVVSQQNMGASAARNHALRLAQGDYIQWLDADDLLAPDKIAAQLLNRQADLTDNSLLSGAFGEFFSWPDRAVFSQHELWQDLSPVAWLSLKFSRNIWMHPGTWLVSRQLTDLAGPWDERLSLDDDGEYFCRVVANSDRVLFVPQAKSFYRLSNMGSLSKSYSPKACQSLFLAVTLSLGYLRALEDSAATKSACLNYLQAHYSCYYPEKKEYVRDLNSIAAELGGCLTPPKLRWEYSLIQKTFGWKAAKAIKHKVRITKLRAHVGWEHLAYRLI